MKKKVIFFGDSNSYITTILYKSFYKNIKNKFELIAVVNTTPKKQNKLKKNIIYLVKKIFNPFDKTIILNRVESYLNFIPKNILLIQANNINDVDFIKTMNTLNIDYAFLMGCPQIFKNELINCFDKVINYHNSYLPTYRGLEATSWAMTNNEKYSGYTFHYINEKIDDGKIVFQEEIEIDYLKSSYENEMIKTQKASTNISKVLELVFNKYEGVEQIGEPSYYGSKQKNELLTFNRISDISMIQRLIEIWGGVLLSSKNESIFVTRVLEDGTIKRIKWLPPKVYTVFRVIKSKLLNNNLFIKFRRKV